MECWWRCCFASLTAGACSVRGADGQRGGTQFGGLFEVLVMVQAHSCKIDGHMQFGELMQLFWGTVWGVVRRRLPADWWQGARAGAVWVAVVAA